MPFSATASLTSTDCNNNLRGLYRDNSDHAVTGTVAETDLASTSITANTIGATGCVHILAMGTITGGAGNKTLRMYLGSTAITDTGAQAGAGDWFIEAWIWNTATNAQRIRIIRGELTGAANQVHDYTTAAIDTTANQTVKVTGQLTNAADTITETMFDIFVCQIT